MSLKYKLNIAYLLALLVFIVLVSVIAILLFQSKTNPSPSLLLSANANEHLVNQLNKKFSLKQGSKNDNQNILQALNNTLEHLQESNQHQVLAALNKLDLSAAIKSLDSLAQQEKKPRNAAKLWVDKGNLQQLQSATLAQIAYQKASELDAMNITASNRLGHYYRQKKQFALAEVAYNNVLTHSPKNSTTQAVAYANFGLLYQAQAKLNQAEKAYLKALDINTLHNNKASMASNSENLAIVYKEKKDFSTSEKHYLNTLSYYQSTKQDSHIALLHTALASLYHQDQQIKKSQQHYEIALNIYLKNKNKHKIANHYSHLGILYQQQRQTDKALILFKKSLSLNKEIKQIKGIADQYGNLGILYRLQKNFKQSERSHLKALEIYQQQAYRESVSQQQTNLGFLYQAWEKTKKACLYWQQARETLLSAKRQQREKRIKHIIDKHCSN